MLIIDHGDVLLKILIGISMDNSIHIVYLDLLNPLTDWDPVQQSELFFATVRPRGIA